MKPYIKPLFTSVATLATLLFPASSGYSAVLSYYDIESSPTQAVTTSAAGLTASDLALAVNGTSTLYDWVGTRVPFINDGSVTNGTVPSVSDPNSRRVTWSLTPDAGNTIAIDQIGGAEIDLLAFINNSGNGTYTIYAQMFVASDATFTTILATSGIMSDTELDFTATGLNTATEVTYATADFDNPVTSSSTLYFAVAFSEDLTSFTGNTSDGTRQVRFDAIQVNGSVIPEPSAALLGGLGLLVLLRRRR